MGLSSELLKKLDGIDPAMRDVLLSVIEEVDQKTRVITVGRGEFEELKDAVKELALLQRENARQLGELAGAQRASESRLTRLEVAVQELAEAQKRTEARVEELAEAQKRTEHSLRELVEDHKDLKKQVGGLAMSVGYGLEDKLIPHLRRFAKREFGIDVTVADRRNIIYDSGKFDEINFYCEGTREGQPMYLIGEAKAQPGKKDFEALDKKLTRLKAVLRGDMEAFLVGYMFDPAVEALAQKRYPHIRRYRTFEVEFGNP